MTSQDKISKRQLIEDLERGMAIGLVGKIPEAELSAARLSSEWRQAHEGGFRLEDCPMLKEHAALVAFDAAVVEVRRAQSQLLLLLARIAKRNLNEVRAEPPPATFAARCMLHLLNCSVLVGKKKDDFAKGWDSFAEQACQPLLLLVQRPIIHLSDLEETLFGPGADETFGALCQQLTSDLELLVQIVELVATTHDRYISQTGRHFSQWISLDHSLASDEWARSGLRILESFKVFAAEFASFANCRMMLIGGNYSEYLLRLLEVVESLRQVISQVEECDGVLFAQQNVQNRGAKEKQRQEGPNFALRAENRLVVRAIAQRLRMNGESMDDIESFARNLIEYANVNQTPCLSILEEELVKLAPRIAPHVLTKTLNHVRINDLNFPLSIKHKARISQIIERSESVAKLAGNSASKLTTQ